MPCWGRGGEGRCAMLGEGRGAVLGEGCHVGGEEGCHVENTTTTCTERELVLYTLLQNTGALMYGFIMQQVRTYVALEANH